MENEKFTMFDEDGIERNAKIITELVFENQNYLVLALEKENDMDSIYVKKLIDKGESVDVVDITDENERTTVFETVKIMINDIGE